MSGDRPTGVSYVPHHQGTLFAKLAIPLFAADRDDRDDFACIYRCRGSARRWLELWSIALLGWMLNSLLFLVLQPRSGRYKRQERYV
jgi:hypothetical protein